MTRDDQRFSEFDIVEKTKQIRLGIRSLILSRHSIPDHSIRLVDCSKFCPPFHLTQLAPHLPPYFSRKMV
jgi:hypothetical protein